MVTVLAVLGVLVVLFACAAVATRDGEVLVDAPPDRFEPVLPAGPLRAGDVDGVRFGMALRGYRMAQVDALLDRLGEELHGRDERVRELEDEVARLREPAERVAAEMPVHASSAVPEAETDGGRARPGPLAVGAGSAVPTADAPSTVGVGARPGSSAVGAGSAVPTADAAGPGEQAPALPDVEVRPGAEPPAPVPFPEPVHTDEPTALPSPAPEQDAAGTGPAQRPGLLGRLAGWRSGRGTDTLRR